MQVSGTLSAPLDAFLDAPSVTVRNTRNISIFSFPKGLFRFFTLNTAFISPYISSCRKNLLSLHERCRFQSCLTAASQHRLERLKYLEAS